MSTQINDPRMADHMANERTFLAWIRTSLGIIAFGFVIERFGLFIRQMGLILPVWKVTNLFSLTRVTS